MVIQFLSVWFVRKSTQLTVHQEHTFVILHWTKQQFFVFDFTRQVKLINVTQCARCALPRHWITSPVSVSMSRDVFQGLVQMFGFNAGIVRWRFSSCLHFKCLNTFLVRVKSARVGDTILYDKHFVANIKTGAVFLITRCHLIMQNSSVPSKASSLPLRSAVEQCPSIRHRTCL